MDITYDSLYPFQRDTTKNIGTTNFAPGAFAYALVLRHDWQHPEWKETLDESSSDSILISKPIPLSSSPEETNGFVPLVLGLNKLNLPSHFYVTFSVKDAFLHNGLLCTLIDRTPFVAIPPPSYSLILTNNYLKGLRAGDERDIQAKIYSDISLPFQVSFSPSGEKGIADLAFKPPAFLGNSKGFINSDLRIKTLPNIDQDIQPYICKHIVKTSVRYC